MCIYLYTLHVLAVHFCEEARERLVHKLSLRRLYKLVMLFSMVQRPHWPQGFTEQPMAAPRIITTTTTTMTTPTTMATMAAMRCLFRFARPLPCGWDKGTSTHHLHLQPCPHSLTIVSVRGKGWQDRYLPSASLQCQRLLGHRHCAHSLPHCPKSLLAPPPPWQCSC